MYHEMKVYGFTLDTLAQRPVVILRDEEGNNSIPIWIASVEAVHLATELINTDQSNQNAGRDFLAKLLDKMALEVARVSIDSLNDGAFAAAVTLLSAAGEIRIDVRPYEALIMSLKFRLPVLVADEVLARGSIMAMGDEAIARENDARRFIEFLEKLDPSDLGKYPM